MAQLRGIMETAIVQPEKGHASWWSVVNRGIRGGLITMLGFPGHVEQRLHSAQLGPR